MRISDWGSDVCSSDLVDARAKAGMVRGFFSNVASRYDLMNDAVAGGMHRLWKNLFVRRLNPRNHEQILDMAGGTGDIAFRLHHEGAAVDRKSTRLNSSH